MKKSLLFALAVLFALACATASAADVPKVQQEIDAMMTRNRTAMEQKDIDMYMSTYWPDAEKVIVRPNGEDIHISGMDAIRANEKKAFEQSPIFKNFGEYRFSEPERAIVGSKATYIRHIKGRGLHLINQYDIVCRDGEWRIIRQVIEAQPVAD